MRTTLLSFVLLLMNITGSSAQVPQKEMEPSSLNPLDAEGFLICTKSNVEGAIDCEKIFLDGFEYTILPYGGVQVVVSLTDNGSHLVALVTVRNTDNRFSPVVDPAKVQIIGFDKNDKAVFLAPIPPQKIASKFVNRAAWASALNSLSASLAKTRTTSSSMVNGNLMITGTAGTSSVMVTGTETTSTTQQDRGAVARADEQNQGWMAGARANAQEVMDTALRANTIFPGKSISGFVYFERKKLKKVVVEVTVGKISFDFPYSYRT